jgi:hypothetical protein
VISNMNVSRIRLLIVVAQARCRLGSWWWHGNPQRPRGFMGQYRVLSHSANQGRRQVPSRFRQRCVWSTTLPSGMALGGPSVSDDPRPWHVVDIF